MDRGARHVVASRGGNRHGVAAHGVPGFLWRISKRAERPELALEEKLRLPKVSILFPYGSVTRSFSLCLPPFLSASFSYSSNRSRNLTSLSLAHIALHHSLSPTLSMFHFYRARALTVPSLRCFLLSVSKLFLTSPFILFFPFLSRLPVFIFLSTRSFIRALASFAPAVSHLSIQPLCLSSSHDRASTRYLPLFFRFSPQPLLASRNRQTFQRFALHHTPVRRRVIVKRLYSLD